MRRTDRRVCAVTNALGNVTVYEYDARGNLTREAGAVYPTRYEYDVYGNRTAMTTFRDEDGEGDRTEWAYDAATGAVVAKSYADGHGVVYALTDLGRPATRTDARGIVTTYTYNVYGDLVSQTYSDATPAVTHDYDAFGRQTQATDAAGTTTFGYNQYGELESEAIVGEYTKTLTHHFDTYGRDAGYSVNGPRRGLLGERQSPRNIRLRPRDRSPRRDERGRELRVGVPPGHEPQGLAHLSEWSCGGVGLRTQA